ncbi:MAG: hypothetical protein Q9199_004618 [Rusavskia elegans]
MPPEASSKIHVPHFNGTLQSVFTHAAALIAVAIFCFVLCKLSQYNKFCPSPRVTFEEQLARKDAELARSNALNDEYVETIDSINGKRALAREELKIVTEELQWYCVNHPVLEAANIALIDQNARALRTLVETEDELDGSRKEACSLRRRLTKLTASISLSPTQTTSIGKMRAGEDNSDWKIQLDVMKGQKKDAVADKIRAEAERDQAVSNEKKAVEECSRKATSLKILMESSDKTKSDVQNKIANLESTNEGLTGAVKKLEAENERQGKALESSVAKGDMLGSTVRRLEKELKETKDDVKNTEKAARSSVGNDALLQAKNITIGQLEGKIKTLEGVEIYAKDLERRYAADVKAWDNSKKEYNNTIQSLRANLGTCTTQYNNATREYNHNLQVHEYQRNDLTQLLEKVQKYHGQSANHVNHLKQTLEGAMKGLAVNGDLDSPSGLEALRQNLVHSFGQYTGYRKLIQGVMEKSGVMGSVDNLEGLQTVQQKFIEFFDSFAPMRLTPKVIRSVMEELKTLQEFKAQMLASQSEGQSDDLGVRLRQAQASLQLLGQELLKAKNDASEKQKTITRLVGEVKRVDGLKKGGDRASEASQSKLRKLEGEYDQLKNNMEKLESRKGTVTQQVEDLNDQVKKLKIEKEDLKNQKWKLLEQYNKARNEGPKPGEESPGPEKRDHSNGSDSDEESPRSAKQARNTILTGGNGVA